MKPLFCSLVLAAVCVGCGPQLEGESEATLKGMALYEQTPLPTSPTNRYADNLDAAKLGHMIFFDRRMSRDREVACASCHVELDGWSDRRRVSLGVDDAEGGRHSMPAHSLPFQRYFFWDGRADSAWSQPLQAIESQAEMDFARTQVAHHMMGTYKAQYESVFGPLPDLSSVPQRAMPGDAQWAALPAARKDEVNRVFANVGKALEAYQRKLTCSETRFDQWARGDVQMTPEEREGAAVFVQRGCVNCHSGAAFSDGKFHRLDVPSLSSDDNGREDGLTKLLDDPFNAAGVYSDDPDFGAALLQQALDEERTVNAYKTPSLRGVTQRKRFGHNGQHTDLKAFLEAFYDQGGRRNQQDRDPLLQGVNIGQAGDEVVAFLGMLSCPPIDAQWADPVRD